MNFPRLFSLIPVGLIVFPLLALFPAATRMHSQQVVTVQVVVRVYIDGLNHPAGTNLTVQLLDTFGSLEKETHTDSGGVVQIPAEIITNGNQGTTKQRRIYGPGGKEKEKKIDICAM